MLGVCFCTNALMEDTNIARCSRLLTNISQGRQQCMKNVQLYSQAPEDLSGLYLVRNFTTTTATSIHIRSINTAKLIEKCVSWYSSGSYPDVQLWTLILLTLKDLWSSIRWAATPCGQRLPGMKEIPKSKIYTEAKKKKTRWGCEVKSTKVWFNHLGYFISAEKQRHTENVWQRPVSSCSL